MIRVENLWFHYDPGEGPVLENVTLHLVKGEYVGIIGPNGSGKTTLVKQFNALLCPTGGDVWVNGKNTKDPVALREIRQTVGMVFQTPDSQIVGMSVEEDVSFGPGNLRLSPAEIRKRVEKSLEVVGMKRYAKRSPHTLSSGEKQLLAIAGAIAMEPQCIVFDEPTAHLDPWGRQRILEVIRDLNRHGMGVVHVTHNMDEIVEASQILVMDDGRILLKDTPKEVFTRLEWLKELGLDIPKINELMWRLRHMGADVRADVLTLDDACLEISSLIKRLRRDEIN
jgi:biotin transport system ATP-binding protein